MENHEATQHEFTRRCLRYFYDEADLDEREQLEDDLPVFAEGINHFGGYDLDQRLAALQTQLRAESAENAKLRAALKPFAEYATTLTNWDIDLVLVARWGGIQVTVGDFRKAATVQDDPTT